MRRPAPGLVLAALLLTASAAARADEPTTTTPAPATASTTSLPAAQAAVQQTTEVAGNVPDLTGRWLIQATLKLPGSDNPATPTVITNLAFWEVRKTEQGQEITVRFVGPPPTVDAEVQEANKARKPWTATPSALRAIRREWDRLPDAGRGIATVASRFLAKESFDEPLKADNDLKDSEWAVVQVMEFAPGGGRPIKEIDAYGAMAKTEHGWRGNHLAATIAAAPFIIPISFRGTFEMFHLDELPEPGLMERIMDVFSGCGRRS